ncbi:MAG: nucleotide-binding protein [Dehalococcoidia bacterium]|nr:nucleotide-binding protein [Dehalococcoidia bacterium]
MFYANALDSSADKGFFVALAPLEGVAMTISRIALIAQLKGFLDELPALKQKDYANAQDFQLWSDKIRDCLRLGLGDAHALYKRFDDASPREIPMFRFGDRSTYQRAYLNEVKSKETALKSVVQALELETSESPDSARPSGAVKESERLKVFISHGGKTMARLELQHFLWQIGMEPVVVDDREKEGRNPDQNVDYWLEQSDFAVVLAEQSRSSKQDEITIPRANVTDEIARIRGKQKPFIVLLEKGMSLGSNQLTGLTYETFPTDHIEASFKKIELELKAAGLLA